MINDVQRRIITHRPCGSEGRVSNVLRDSPLMEHVFEQMSKSSVANFRLDSKEHLAIRDVLDDAISVNIVGHLR